MHPLGPAPVLEHVAPSWVLKMGMGSPPLGGTPGQVFLSPCAWQCWPQARGLPLPSILVCFTSWVPNLLAELGMLWPRKVKEGLASPQQCR